MKVRLLISLVIGALLLTGCAAGEPERAADAAGDLVRSAAAAVPTLPAAVPTEPDAVQETGAILSREEAERIALEYAGFTADQADGLRIEFEMDEGIQQYDVEFRIGQREYEFEIDAQTGKILSYDVDALPD